MGLPRGDSRRTTPTKLANENCRGLVDDVRAARAEAVTIRRTRHNGKRVLNPMRKSLALCGFIASALLLAGCSGGEESAPTTYTRETPTSADFDWGQETETTPEPTYTTTTNRSVQQPADRGVCEEASPSVVARIQRDIKPNVSFSGNIEGAWMLMLDDPSNESIIVGGLTADLPSNFQPLVWEITERDKIFSLSLNTAEITTGSYAGQLEPSLAAAVMQVQRCVRANAAVE
ncbi:hypothetical protein [Gordonia sp. KTR9]|uniref:hypothetical protein n=1 Tax=Gordonia sp. KTR9 TaxID=337191 RepID=UPI0011D187A7|nr:hypothetical protein [Gordonia sp. KTR9]